MSCDKTPVSYADKKRFFDQLLTIYGRNTVLEALEDESIPAYRLHLASSNRRGDNLDRILALARRRGIEVIQHSREALARISRNQRQDQGVALDLKCPRYGHFQDFLQQAPRVYQLIALDRITNPQNLGMVIRSVCASPMQGLLLPEKGCAALSPLVIKASAGSIFRCPIYRCGDLVEALRGFIGAGAEVCVLSADASVTLAEFRPRGPVVYVLGNETSGVSDQVAALARHRLAIPMRNGVESLNVAVTAALLAFRDVISTVG